MSTYEVLKTENLSLICTDPLHGMYKLSPFVWEENGSFHILIRAVNTSEDPTQKVARIYYGESADGVRFKMSDGPAIAPSTRNLDKDGCEDPTLIKINGQYLVYYTGWNQTKLEGQLLMAKGTGLENLAFAGITIPSETPYINPKEATVTQLKNGQWILYFEYTDQQRSQLAASTANSPEGPWRITGNFLQANENSWDSYHLSPGPVLTDPQGQTVMFYNGSDSDARWRIGWLKIDDNGDILERSKHPLISPPPSKPGETDIAFAASAILVRDKIWLYYTTADSRTCRAIIRIN